MRFNLRMVRGVVYKIRLWVVSTHKIAICGRSLACSMDSEARLLRLESQLFNNFFSSYFTVLFYCYIFYLPGINFGVKTQVWI